MSQYTISIKSIINIKSHPAPYNDVVFADTAKKIERGREIFFNFNYAGDDDFKRLFENAFLVEYLERDIYCNDVDLFLIALRNDIEIKSPLFYKRYEAIKTLEKNLLSKGETTTSSGAFSENSNDNTNDSESSRDTRSDSSSGGSNNKSLGATYPQNLIVTNRIESVKYSDSGAFSENSSSASSSGNSTRTGTRTGTRNGSRDGENKNVSTREINSLDKIELYIAAQRDIIDEFVKSLSPLFIHIF